jgi:hypothetical protein
MSPKLGVLVEIEILAERLLPDLEEARNSRDGLMHPHSSQNGRSTSQSRGGMKWHHS